MVKEGHPEQESPPTCLLSTTSTSSLLRIRAKSTLLPEGHKAFSDSWWLLSFTGEILWGKCAVIRVTTHAENTQPQVPAPEETVPLVPLNIPRICPHGRWAQECCYKTALHRTKWNHEVSINLRLESRKRTYQREQSRGAPTAMRACEVRGSGVAAGMGSTCSQGRRNVEAAPGHEESAQWRGKAVVHAWESGKKERRHSWASISNWIRFLYYQRSPGQIRCVQTIYKLFVSELIKRVD